MDDIDDILADVAADADPTPLPTRDLRALTQAWISERCAPELLPYPAELMARVMERVRGQIERVELETGNMDPKTNFRLIIVQTELERFKFLVRSFLRARIAKIDKYALHLLTTPALKTRLSPPELQYLTQHQTLLHAHTSASFLRQFPEALRRLDDTAGGISMIEAPDLEGAVFVRVVREGEGEGEGGMEEWGRGEVHVVRYGRVREAVGRGDMVLI